MKAVDFAVSQILPPDMRQDTYDLSKKGISAIMGQVASRYPEKFAEITKALGMLGRRASWYQGYTIGPEDTRPVLNTDDILSNMDSEIAELRKLKLADDEFEERRNSIYLRYSDLIEKETLKHALPQHNAFAVAAASGARGNASHSKSLLSTPGVFSDASGRLIPMFVRNSYAKGVRPAELMAGTYGGRASVVSTKRSTARGGDFLKILTQNTSLFNVTQRDCGTDNGIDLPASDASLVGRVLARETNGIPAGSVVDRHVAAKLRKALGDKPVIVRSAMSCRARHGLCAHCVGVQADGKFPRIGESVGITAGDAIGEPIVQGALNVKHNAGMAKGKRAFSGFEVISQFVQVPEEFKDRAAVAEHDGEVEKIEPAPQGGTLIWVGGKAHLALPGFDPTVKVGDKIEAGDTLSEGLTNPADVVRLKGLGAGREYYRERLGQILTDSGNPPERRNMEIIARAAVDNFIVTDPDEDDPWLPDDHVREADLMAAYREAPDTREAAPAGAVGGYLQRPVLHFTVGTRVTPKLADRMQAAGVTRVPVSYQEPKFQSDMPRLRVAAHNSRDWLQSLGTSYLSSQLQQSLERGDETNVRENVHFGPRLAYGADAGSGGFAENIERTGMF